MKYLFLFCIILFALPALAQRAEVVKDSVRLYLDTTECNTVVWFAQTYVKYRGGKENISYQIIGGSDSDPCAGIAEKDTAGLFQAIANGVLEFDGKTRTGLLDYGRQLAKLAENFIFQPRALKSYTELNRALVAAGMPGLFKTMEKSYADSLVGNYILVRPGVNNANVTVTKTAQGAVRIRVNAQNIFPITVYSDRWILANNIAGTDQNVDLYQIEQGRWVSLLGNYQLVKSARQVVQRGVK